MKITIDSDNKTIQVHDTVPIKELKKYLKDHVELEEYSIIGFVTIYSYYPYSPTFVSPIYNPDPLHPTFVSSSTTLTTTP